MTVNNYVTRLVEYDSKNALELQKAVIEGSWWHFRRVYALKSEDGKICTIRLNWFERLQAHLLHFGMEGFFKKVFEGHKLTLIDPKEILTVAKELKIGTAPNPTFITPKNIEEHVDLNHEYDLDYIGEIEVSKNGKKPGYLFTILLSEIDKTNQGVNVDILKDRFAVHQENTKDTYHYFDTLKDVFDHLFRGRTDQEEVFKDLESLTLISKEGFTFQYRNPFLKKPNTDLSREPQWMNPNFSSV